MKKTMPLYPLLAARNMDVTKLAEQIFAGRSHVNQVLLGTRTGSNTWKKLERVLTKQEFDLARAHAATEGMRYSMERLQAADWRLIEAVDHWEKWSDGKAGFLISFEENAQPPGIDDAAVASLVIMRIDAARVLRSYGLGGFGVAV